MSTARELLAGNMKKYRQIFGWSQADLAEKVGCSTTLIGNIEIKKRFPSAENIDRIAEALEVSPADLFTETESKVIKQIMAKEELKAKLEKNIIKVINETLK